MALFRGYATAQITTYADAAVGAATTGTDGIDGTAVETLGAGRDRSAGAGHYIQLQRRDAVERQQDSGLLVGDPRPRGQ